jgi:hypothetical protein
MSHLSNITKSIELDDDLLSNELRKSSPKKTSLQKLEIDNSPILKIKEEMVETTSQQLVKSYSEDSIVNNITHTETEIKPEEVLETNVENCNIIINNDENNEISVDTVIEKQEEILKTISGLKNQTPEKKKPSRLKELFSMAIGSTTTNPKKNVYSKKSTDSTSKLISILEKKATLRKKISMMTEPSFDKYHEAMSSIDNSDLNLSKFNVPVSPIDRTVKTESYRSLVKKLSQKGLKKITGLEIPRRIKITSTMIENDDLYIPEPFYVKDVRPELMGKKVEKKKLLIHHLGKKFIYDSNIFHHIVNEIEYQYFEEKNNGKLKLTLAYKNKILIKLEPLDFLKKLITQFNLSKIAVSTMRVFDNISLKLIITYGVNNNNIKGLFIRLYHQKNDLVANETFVSFDRLLGYFKLMNYNHSFIKGFHIKYVNNLEAFIEKIFINHCYFYIHDNLYHIGVLARPVGVFCNESYSFPFLKTMCSIEFNILENKNVQFFIFCKENDSKYIHINIVIDDSSFDRLFSQLDDMQYKSFDGEKKINHYRFVDIQHLSKNGNISNLLLRVQEILRFKYSNTELSFDELVLKNNDIIYKLQIENEMNNIDFYMLQAMNDYKWMVEYYGLKKLESKIF